MALTEARRTGEFLISEASGTRSREEVTIAAAAGAMVAGTVLGKITASSKYVAYNNAAADGSEVAAGILYNAVADLAVDQKVAAYVRDAEVTGIRLTGLDTPGTADLKALGIIVR